MTGSLSLEAANVGKMIFLPNIRVNLETYIFLEKMQIRKNQDKTNIELLIFMKIST